MEVNDKNQINIEAYKTKMQTIFYNMDIKNNICADCGKKKSMDFASINNGIIICSECAKEHQSLGYNISFIHSLGEKWDDYLFNYIKVGGNSRFMQFCKDYKLNKEDGNIIQKYKSKGLAYYRDILRSEVLGYDPPENINVNKAYEEEKNIPDNYPEFKKYTFVKHVDMNYLEKKFYTKKEEKSEEGFFGKIGGFFGNVKKNIEDLDIVKKVQDISINDVKQKGADMFGYFFFGGKNEEQKEEKKEDKNEDKNNKDESDVNEIKNKSNNYNNMIDNEKEKDKNENKEINNIFGVKVEEYKESINSIKIKENNNINQNEVNDKSKNKIAETKNENEIKKENEDKIEIKEEMQILTEDINNNIINKPNTNDKKEEIKENNEENIKKDDNDNKENSSKEEKGKSEKDIEEILKDNNYSNDNSKMNNEEKDELEKMLQE